MWQCFHDDFQSEKGTQSNLLSNFSTLKFLQCSGEETILLWNTLSEEK